MADFEKHILDGTLDALTASEDYVQFFKYMQSVKIRKDWVKETRPTDMDEDESDLFEAMFGFA